MATSWPSLLPSALCLLLLCQVQVSLGQLPFGQGQQQPYQAGRRFWEQQRECRVERLDALQPTRRVQAEAGVIEYWDQNHDQFQCAGVAPYRITIESKGLLLPFYANAPRVVHVIQGRGVFGSVMPGCPETFQSYQQSQPREEDRRGQKFYDQHQRIYQFREGDVLAFPAGVATWCYNDGDTPVVTVSVADTSNYANQLDQRLRRFELAGTQQRRESYEAETAGEEASGNVFTGFDVETLSDALGVSRDTARKLQSHDDRRGNIVRVERGLQLVRPAQRTYYGQETEEELPRTANGLEETFCTLRQRENIDNPSRADVYNPQAGRVTSLNSQKLPILRFVQMSVERGVLYRNAHYVPHWNINAHSVVYIIRGSGRMQISGHKGSSRFDREVRQGQIVVIPQNFAVTVRASGSENFEWVSFKTTDNAMVSPLAGKASVFRGLPEDVIATSYRVSREEARRIKYNRGQEFLVFTPSGGQGGRASA